MTSSSWLITGANRGIGYGIVSSLILRPNTTVVAAVRDPKSAAENLDALTQKAADGSKIVIVKISCTSETDAKAAVEELKQQGIHKLDVVIANAGISNYYGPILSTPADQLHGHFEVNTIGMVILFQAVWPLLEQSKQPKFVYMSSLAGSISTPTSAPNVAYGASKAAGNFIMAKIHREHPSLITFSLHPGRVLTDLTQEAIKALSRDHLMPTQAIADSAISVDQSVVGVLNRVDTATRENSGGRFKHYEEDVDVGW